jgi:hypothetical protein
MNSLLSKIKSIEINDITKNFSPSSIPHGWLYQPKRMAATPRRFAATFLLDPFPYRVFSGENSSSEPFCERSGLKKQIWKIILVRTPTPSLHSKNGITKII